MPETKQSGAFLSRATEFSLAAIGGVMVANAYYIHPIISEVAADFGVNAATIGLVPALNQIALAVGIFLLLPLGDRFSNRQLAILFGIGQTVSLGLMVFATSFEGFLAGSTILGFFTIAPYLLPAYASKRVNPDRLGAVTATLTLGTIFGILAARVGAGVIAQYYDWHLVYVLAAILMAVTTLSLPFILEGRKGAQDDQPKQSYFALVGSLFSLLKEHPQVIISGIIQALNFGIFLAVWLGLALHLTSAEMGYGVDIVGYLAVFAIVAMFVTPKLGALADRIGAEQARFRISLVQMAGIALLYPLGGSLWLLIIPIICMNTVGPGIDVTGRMTTLSLAPEARTRLMTGYIMLMFMGAGIASWAGTAAYEVAGWAGNAALAFAMSVCLVGLSWRQAVKARARTS
ncbi:MFS transporter [Pontixanthobacter aquaemixtae]|uniref:MFS transporter n=1 Tax=Pontixanthobacter aquaemixtae TaxID=1958940 RepID=A0A844ZRD7_9SPHN|nr:MFS transporter [Pontixanthobacter aquaemixtae]MXO90308.1 MFS transporter [Pontixanthobacter aquaemixtae]